MSEPEYRSSLDVHDGVYHVRVTRKDPGPYEHPKVIVSAALSEADIIPAHVLLSDLLRPLHPLPLMACSNCDGSGIVVDLTRRNGRDQCSQCDGEGVVA